MFKEFLERIHAQFKDEPEKLEAVLGVLGQLQESEGLMDALVKYPLDSSWARSGLSMSKDIGGVQHMSDLKEASVFMEEEVKGGGTPDSATLYAIDIEDISSSELEPVEATVDIAATIAIGPSPEATAVPITPSVHAGLDSDRAQPTTIGRYRDLGLLGMGAMGEVRLVRDETLNRNLAMKIIHPRFVKSRNAMSRFVEEAQIGAQLQYANIVPVHELGRLSDGRLYFTMKQIKGRTLSDLIDELYDNEPGENNRPLDDQILFRRLIQIFHTICETMAFAHSLGVVHRDLKPENIMVGDFGEVLVVDWGVAKVLGQERVQVEELVHTTRTETNALKTRMGSVTGTPVYMSPEQAMGLVDQVGTHSDVYTLGAILYEILSGCPPYTGRSSDEVLEKVKSLRPRSLNTLSTQNDSGSVHLTGKPGAIRSERIPPVLVQICEQAMERNISDRHASASVLATSVSDWLVGAQKRDKALSLFHEAESLKAKATEATELFSKYWDSANELLSNSSTNADEGWEQWTLAQNFSTDAESHRLAYNSKLRASLVHDPDLIEANHALASLLIDSELEALATGGMIKSALTQEVNTILQKLPAETQQGLNTLRLRQQQDDLLLQRIRCGQLVGRKDFLEEIIRAVEAHRLVTLIGVAGTGKTRLSLEALFEMKQDGFRQVFCDLTEASEALGVAMAVAKALGLQLRAVDPIGQLGGYFKDHACILVLDNLEQVIEPAGEVISAWLSQSNALKIIATSRIKLRLPEEHALTIPPLSLLEGVELFVRRAQAVAQDFQLQVDNRSSIIQLVNQLDRLPLAIELASARLTDFSVSELADRLKARFSLLRSRDSNVQALQGALDWSWGLLEPWTQVALAQLSVFHGGFDRQAAEAVVSVDNWVDAPPVVDILQDICDASMLQASHTEEGTTRYTLLESIREYGRVHLAQFEQSIREAPVSVPHHLAVHRHAQYYSQFGEKSHLNALERQHDSSQWTVFVNELDNFLAGAQHGIGTVAFKCCMAAVKVLNMKGPMSLGVELVSSVQKKQGLSALETKQLRTMRMRFLRISGRVTEARLEHQAKRSETGFSKEDDVTAVEAEGTEEARTNSSGSNTNELRMEAEQYLEQAHLEESEASYPEAIGLAAKAFQIFQNIGAAKGQTESKLFLGLCLTRQEKHTEAIPHLNEALQLSETHELPTLEAEASRVLGMTLKSIGEFDQSFTLLSRALELNTLAQNQSNIALNLGNLGALHRAQGDYEEAIEFFQQSLLKCQQIGNKRGEAHALGSLSVCHYHLSKHEQSRALIDRSIELNRLLGNKRSLINNLTHLGILHSDRSDYDSSIAVYTEAISIAQSIDFEAGLGRLLGNLACSYSSLAQVELAIQTFSQALEIDDRIQNHNSKISNLINLGALYSKLSQFDQAIAIYQEAASLSQQIGEVKKEGVVLCNLGAVYVNLDRLSEAKACFYRSIEIARQIKNKRSEGINLANLAEVLFKTGELDRSIELFKQAIELCKHTAQFVLCEVYLGLAEAYLVKGNTNEALNELLLGEPMAEKRPMYYVQYLCTKAKVFHQSHKPKAAKLELERAMALRDELSLPDPTILNQTIESTVATLNRPPSTFKSDPQSSKEVADCLVQAEAKLEQGALDHSTSQFDSALSHYDEALRLFELANDVSGKVRTLHLLGQTHLSQSRYTEALSKFQSALEWSTSHDLVRLRADSLGHIGKVYFEKDDHSISIDFLQQSLAIHQSIGNRQGEGRLLGDLGAVYTDLNEADRALEAYAQALEAHRRFGDLLNEARILANIALIYMAKKDFECALSYFEDALEINHQTNNRKSVGHVLHNLGRLFALKRDYERSNEHYREAEDIARQIGNLKGLCRAVGNRGINHWNQGDLESAIICFQVAAKTAKDIGHSRLEEFNEGYLASSHAAQAQYDLAIKHYRYALEINRAINNHRREGIVLGNLAWVYCQKSDWESAITLFKEARALCLVHSKPAFGAFSASLAWALVNQGHHLEAVLCLSEGEMHVHSHAIEYGKFLLLKAQVYQVIGEAKRAQNAFDQALAHVSSNGLDQNSEIVDALRDAKAFF